VNEVDNLLKDPHPKIFDVLPHLHPEQSYAFEKKIGELDLASYIDHTLLKPNATEKDLLQVCDEAKSHNFKAVCVNGSRVKLVVDTLKEHRPANTDRLLVAAVVGFPLGAVTSEQKASEAKELVQIGASEIDMVINIGSLKDVNYDAVLKDISAVVTASHGAAVKVILETSLLNDTEVIDACILSALAGAHFVKTSTGFGGGGATLHHVQILRHTVGDKLKVKASGGVRSYEDAVRFIEAGADRLGTSSGVAIMSGKTAQAGVY